MVKQVVIRIDDDFFDKIVRIKNRRTHTWPEVLEAYVKMWGSK